MVNYGNSLIYKLCCKDFNIDKIYVGSTVNFSRKKAEHKKRLNDIKYNKNKLYQFILNNGGWENWDMIEIMKYPCNDKRELDKKQSEIMKELKAELNSKSPFNTEEERKEYKIKDHKKYYENNKEEIREKQKEKQKEKEKEREELIVEGFNDILDYEGLYKINKEGEVYSVKRKSIMKPRKNNQWNYYEIILSKNKNP